ncbi:MAG TPA: hypothetical protein VFN53_05105 [Acidobacteriaceae bacterium]|nr:hypothetical protein [Acidobacteriaceae bacterium]
MELFFNLAWVLLSLILLVSLRLRLSGSEEAGCASNRWLRSMAVCLLCFLLLPVISMTDDLHAATTMAEGERSYRKVCLSCSRHLQALSPMHPAAAISKDGFVFGSACYGTIVLPAHPAANSPRSILLRADRAPPASLLR